MSIFNGKVEANATRRFNTFKEALAFIETLEPDAFEGIQVRGEAYFVNFFKEVAK